MSTLLLTCLLSMMHIAILQADSEPTVIIHGSCDDAFDVFKYTMATSDAERACDNAYRIFPDIHEFTGESSTSSASNSVLSSHTNQCAGLCKLELPDTCFQLHAPESREYDEGLIPISSFEEIMDSKWEYALKNKQYESFLDYGVAFWVQSLDDFIAHWQSSDDLQYLGIEWTLPLDLGLDQKRGRGKCRTDCDKTPFYSILVHSPQSQIQYEFMSFTKPDLYDDVDWMMDTVPRCSFGILHQSGNYTSYFTPHVTGRFSSEVSRFYPWNRPDEATIVPVRISRATSSVAEIVDFYEDVFGADVYGFETDLESDDGDKDAVSSVFVRLSGAQIEIQFVERPPSSTFGDFTVNHYEALLKDSHSAVISSPFCGQDRWMDNNIGYFTWELAGGLDVIHSKLEEKDDNEVPVIYKMSKFPVEYASERNKVILEELGYGGSFMVGMFVVDPTGHSIHNTGTLSDKELIGRAPLYDHRCAQQCTEEMDMKAGSVLFDINALFERYDIESTTINYFTAAVFAVVLLWFIWINVRRGQLKSAEVYTAIS